MVRCPFCRDVIKIIETAFTDRYVPACVNTSCPLIFRTKQSYASKEEAQEAIIEYVNWIRANYEKA